MARKIRIDMTGLRFGRLVGVTFVERSRSGHAQWLFACDCGAEVVANGSNVRAGTTASCGCLHREISAARFTTHGHRAGRRHGPTYRAWQEMKTLCSNPKSPRFRDFGGRAVAVCPAWAADFLTFLADMGERPDGAILVRLDEAVDFTPTNCAWIPVASRQARAEAGHRRRGMQSLRPASAGQDQHCHPVVIDREMPVMRRHVPGMTEQGAVSQRL